MKSNPDALRSQNTWEIAKPDLWGEPQGIACPLPSSPGAVSATTTDKISRKVIFKLPRGSAVPLWVYLKSSGQLQYIITNQQEGGRRGRRREGRREVFRSIRDCFCEKLTVKRWQGCRQVKDAPRGVRVKERGCIRRTAKEGEEGNLRASCENPPDLSACLEDVTAPEYSASPRGPSCTIQARPSLLIKDQSCNIKHSSSRKMKLLTQSQLHILAPHAILHPKGGPSHVPFKNFPYHSSRPPQDQARLTYSGTTGTLKFLLF